MHNSKWRKYDRIRSSLNTVDPEMTKLHEFIDDHEKDQLPILKIPIIIDRC
jgi:hypothetical protein